MRVALYARYSTDDQDVLSIAVQLEHCRTELVKRGWIEVLCFTDAAQSAATLHRPGMQALIAAARRGEVDIIYADAMDRLSRSLADVAMLHEQCRFLGIQVVPREEGLLTPMHIGMKGTMNAESLAVTASKTRDALRHRFKTGQSPGGMFYDDQARIEHDGNGDRIKGLVQIIAAQAHVVNFIMTEYVAGRSPGRSPRISIVAASQRRAVPNARSVRSPDPGYGVATPSPATLHVAPES